MLSLHDGAQKLFLLLLGAVFQKLCSVGKRNSTDLISDCAISVRQLLHHQRPSDHATVGAAPLGRHADAVKPEAADLLPDVRGDFLFFVPLQCVRHDFATDELSRHVANGNLICR